MEAEKKNLPVCFVDCVFRRMFFFFSCTAFPLFFFYCISSGRSESTLTSALGISSMHNPHAYFRGI